MGDRRAELIGGPLCGQTIPPRALVYVWVATRRIKAVPTTVTFDRPGPSRALYRRMESGAYFFVGYRCGVCRGCETPQERTETGGCPVCGARLIPA